MILPWMIYAIGVSAAFGAAAWLVERAFRDLRWPSPRFVWLIAMVGSFVLPWIPRQSQSINSVAGGSGSGLDFIGLVSGEPILVGPTYATLDRALALVWLTLAVVLGVRTAMAMIAARRMARKWQPQRLAGNDVLLSESTGPAVTGFLGGRIVVPEWLLSWERESQQLVVRHELEHVRARDPVLRLFATLVCVAVPWNLALWWHRRRIELAIELDCDRRVLAHYPDRERYGGLLLQVAEAGFSDRSGLPAFSHPASALERRIKMILTPHGPRAYTRSALTLIAATGVVFGAQSCAGPNAPDSGYLTALATSEVVAPELPQDRGLILPGTPEDGQLELMLAEHHPDVVANGLPEEQSVWFIIDDDLNIVRTGIGEHEGLEERLRADYPDEATEYILGLGVPLGRDIEVEVFLMVPEPQLGSVPPGN